MHFIIFQMETCLGFKKLDNYSVPTWHDEVEEGLVRNWKSIRLVISRNLSKTVHVFYAGIDAQISYAFHSEQKLHPEKFRNQLHNRV